VGGAICVGNINEANETIPYIVPHVCVCRDKLLTKDVGCVYDVGINCSPKRGKMLSYRIPVDKYQSKTIREH
jgi:hypothetical protein